MEDERTHWRTTFPAVSEAVTQVQRFDSLKRVSHHPFTCMLPLVLIQLRLSYMLPGSDRQGTPWIPAAKGEAPPSFADTDMYAMLQDLTEDSSRTLCADK